MSPRSAARLSADLMVAHRPARSGLPRHRHAAEVRRVDAGRLHPARGRAHRGARRLATALVDGQKGLGHPASVLAMELAIAKAETYGIGIVAVRNSNHSAPARNYSMMALARGMIGLRGDQLALRGHGADLRPEADDGHQPARLAAPAARHAPFVLDMATTTVAVGKLTIASRWNKPIPEGWGLDAQGRPTSDAREILASRLPPPLGGSRELGSHKGYGLGVMVDILSGVLSAAASTATCSTAPTAASARRHNTGHCFAAIDIERFRPVDDFTPPWTTCCRSLTSTPRADGEERIYTAGEPEAECEKERLAKGIPLAPALVGSAT